MTGYDLIEELLRLPADALNQPVIFIKGEIKFYCPECDTSSEIYETRESIVINSISPFSLAPDANGNFIRLQ